MDKSNSFERRFTLNATHLPSPIAESTCLNFNVHGGPSPFPWGASPISRKNRSYAGSLTNNTVDHRSGAHRVKATGNKIDPRVYADVQSRGLTTRIVKYHDNGSRLNRSMSASNLYSRPGQFPVVHLRKAELPFKASKSNVSMTRIQPPGKSIFYGNTLSGLLRSNSVLSLRKSDEEIAPENRPILHPPPTDNELAPTRSVLDVLKEISRKRINSDDFDPHDLLKKPCTRPAVAEVVDGPNYVTAEDSRSAPNYKRQRDDVNGAATPPNGSPSKAQPMSQKTPEQLAKRRFCSYNNGITSSLSSSRGHSKRRQKTSQHPPFDGNQSDASSPNDHGGYNDNYQRHKIARPEKEQRFEQLSKSSSCATSTIPIPVIPLTQAGLALSNSLSDGSSQDVTVPAQRSERVEVLKMTPKITLFNQNYETFSAQTTKKAYNNTSSDDITAVANEYMDIPFVKPKKSLSVNGARNPIIERTQKSKLALMLCGLRGELYQGCDEVDDVLQDPRSVDGGSASVPIATVTITKTTSTTSTTATLKKHEGFAETMAGGATAVTPPTMPAIIDSNGLKAKAMPAEPTTPATSSVLTTITTTTTMAMSSNTTTDTVPLPILGGFSFKPSSTTTTASVAPDPGTIASPVQQKSPLVGLKLTPASKLLNLGTMPINGGNTTATATSSVATAAAQVPVLVGFSFDAPKAVTSTDASTRVTPTFGSLSNSGNTFGNLTSAIGGSAALAYNFNGAAPTTTTGTKAPTFASFAAPNASSITAATKTNDAVVALPSFNIGATVSPTKTFCFGDKITSKIAPAETSKMNEGDAIEKHISAKSEANLFSNSQTLTGPTDMNDKRQFGFTNAHIGGTVRAGVSGKFTNQTALPLKGNGSEVVNRFVFNTTSAKPTTATAPFAFSDAKTADVFGFSTPTTTPPAAAKAAASGAATENAPAVSAFTFGSRPTVPLEPTFGSGNKTFSFGATTLNGQTQSQTHMPATPAFGSGAFTFGAEAGKPAATAGFSFGGSSGDGAAPAVAGNIFAGVPAANHNGAVPNPSFSFGDATTTPASSAPKSLFGSPAAAAAAGSFGGFETAAPTTNQNKTFTFGSAGGEAGSMFGASPVTTANVGNNTNAAGKSVGGAFGFGGGNGKATSTSAGASAPATFAFSDNIPTAAFNFGSSTNAAPASGREMKAATFTFGGAGTPNVGASGSNVFGGAANVAPAAAFNFGTSIVTAPQPTPVGAVAANLFGASPTPGDRPMRRATRRLHKS